MMQPDMMRSEAKHWLAVPAISISRPVALPLAVALFALLTALGAHVAVPLGVTPVPMTLQTLFVMLAGALLGPVAGAASQLLYLALGVAGAPVFALGGAGLPWIFGPTGGYLMAFPMAAALTGWIAGRERKVLRATFAFLAGTVIIFALGAAWLSVVTDMGPAALFAAAVQPFLPGAAAKVAIGVIVIRLYHSRMGRKREAKA
jgi:biotin transport system substrate-specific component